MNPEMTREQQWKLFADTIGGDEGKEIAAAYREMYALFDDSLVRWAANLYDPVIGGFYYSNGARDNEGFLPDLESTHQALEMFADLGLADGFGGSYAKALPAWMGEKTVAFVKKMQRPNGYFYHPQWTVESTDAHVGRRGRDLMWANSILRNYGVLPTYDTPDGVKGENPAERPAAVASEGKKTESGTYAPFLQDRESFREYLEKQPLTEHSYGVGNTLAAQIGQIKVRDAELGGALFEELFPWLEKHQNTARGTWEFREPGDEGYIPYHGQNGLFKLSFVYNAARVPIPHIEKSIQTAMDALYSREPVGIVCDIYNSWYTLSSLFSNIHVTHTKEEAARKIAEIRRKLYRDAPGAIRLTKEKIQPFRKPDGGFSYLRHKSSELSQGMPVTLPNMPESDVNATIISAPQLIHFSMDVLGLKENRVPIFTEKEYRMYIDILEENRARAERRK